MRRSPSQNSADLGQSITLAGYSEDGGDATAEMDYVILDSSLYLALPQPPLTCALTPHTPGKLIEKVLDVIGTGVGLPQFVNADTMMKRALHLWGHTERNGDLAALERPGAPASGPAWEATSRMKPVTRWRGSPTSARSSS